MNNQRNNSIIPYPLIIMLTVFVLFAITTNYYAVQAHEATHKAIFHDFGVNSTVKIYDLGILGGSTLANQTQWRKLTPNEQAEVRALQSENEVVGYQFTIVEMPVLDAMMVVMILILYLQFKKVG